MSLNERKPAIRYSISFKQMVVKELEEQGSTIGYLQRKYGITGSDTIGRWIRSFGHQHLLKTIIRVETMDEKNRLKQLEEENKRLKLALADAFMAKDCLEGVIDLANKEFKTDLKKNFGDKSVQPGKPGTR